MKNDENNLAILILQRLCKNAEISGIRFGPILQILLTSEPSQKFSIKGQVYLNLSSRWKIFDSRPSHFPESEEELTEMTNEEEILTIISMREKIIKKVELGKDSPHLILTLDDERIIFVNGKDEMYESWEIGIAFGHLEQLWQVIACPNGELAIWTPPNFSFDIDLASLKENLSEI